MVERMTVEIANALQRILNPKDVAVIVEAKHMCSDERALRALLIRYPIFTERRLPVILQPEGDTATLDYPPALEHLAEHLRDPFWDKYHVRVLPQMHVIIWGRRRWV